MKRTMRRREIVQPDDPTTRLIALTQGEVALVDADKYEELNQFNWSAKWNPSTSSFYAHRAICGGAGARFTTVTMHAAVLGRASGMMIDHLEGNTLDNRICKLRHVTPQQNSQNQKLLKSNVSGYRGVYFHRGNGKWRARITVDGKKKSLGLFETVEAAASAYAEAARIHHGEFRRL